MYNNITNLPPCNETDVSCTEKDGSCWVLLLPKSLEKNPCFCLGVFCGIICNVPLLSWAAGVSCVSFCSLIGWAVVGVTWVGVAVTSVWLVDGVSTAETLTDADTELGTETVSKK